MLTKEERQRLERIKADDEAKRIAKKAASEAMTMIEVRLSDVRYLANDGTWLPMQQCQLTVNRPATPS
jgi:hypothetical protein